jgi:sigma-B regulation protein RsbU (phosphoserine phosphatase)
VKPITGKADVWQGTLALMVLRTLEALGPLHGYGIARRIEQTSGGRLSVNYGTLYPALLELEQEGYIASEWGASDSNQKIKYYKLKSIPSQRGLARENAQLVAAIGEEVAHRESLDREMQFAREVQQRLFPQELPVVSGLDYCGACRPALGVGGDYYDFLKLPDGKLGVAIGDVSGKGIAAALMMASLQASLRIQTMDPVEDLGSIIARVNRLLYDASSSDRYATLFFAIYDPATRILNYVNAGHLPPVVMSASHPDSVARLDSGGTVVGLLSDVTYARGEKKLDVGDTLLAFTDGITETMNATDEEWGEQRLTKTFLECGGLTSRQIMAKIIAGADQFAAGAKQHDDMTVVVLRVEERS